jgi:hypothetical protein
MHHPGDRSVKKHSLAVALLALTTVIGCKQHDQVNSTAAVEAATAQSQTVAPKPSSEQATPVSTAAPEPDAVTTANAIADNAGPYAFSMGDQEIMINIAADGNIHGAVYDSEQSSMDAFRNGEFKSDGSVVVPDSDNHAIGVVKGTLDNKMGLPHGAMLMTLQINIADKEINYESLAKFSTETLENKAVRDIDQVVITLDKDNHFTSTGKHNYWVNMNDISAIAAK